MSTYPSLYRSLPSNLPTSDIVLPKDAPLRLKKAIVAMALYHHLETSGEPIDVNDLPYDMSFDEAKGVLSFDLSSLPTEVLSKISELVRMAAT
jgi:hypothetical protein